MKPRVQRMLDEIRNVQTTHYMFYQHKHGIEAWILKLEWILQNAKRRLQEGSDYPAGDIASLAATAIGYLEQEYPEEK